MARKVTEVTTTDDRDDRVVDGPRDRTSTAVVLARIISLIGGTLIALIGIRVLLSLLGANRANAFADLIYGVTYPFVAPFFGLFGYEVEYGVSRLEIESIVAMLVYAAITALLVRAATIDRSDRTAV